MGVDDQTSFAAFWALVGPIFGALILRYRKRMGRVYARWSYAEARSIANALAVVGVVALASGLIAAFSLLVMAL